MFFVTALAFLMVLFAVVSAYIVHSLFTSGPQRSALRGLLYLLLYGIPVIASTFAFMLFVRSVQIAYGH